MKTVFEFEMKDITVSSYINEAKDYPVLAMQVLPMHNDDRLELMEAYANGQEEREAYMKMTQWVMLTMVGGYDEFSTPIIEVVSFPVADDLSTPMEMGYNTVEPNQMGDMMRQMLAGEHVRP